MDAFNWVYRAELASVWLRQLIKSHIHQSPVKIRVCLHKSHSDSSLGDLIRSPFRNMRIFTTASELQILFPPVNYGIMENNP